jgi:hypothetical protein
LKRCIASSAYLAFIHKIPRSPNPWADMKICEDGIKKNPVSIVLILTLSIPEERPLEEQWSCHYITRKVPISVGRKK